MLYEVVELTKPAKESQPIGFKRLGEATTRRGATRLARDAEHQGQVRIYRDGHLYRPRPVGGAS